MSKQEGIRKVNEWIVQPGRTLTVTDSTIEFTNFIDGTMFISEDGYIKAKVKGETDWKRLTPSHYFDNKTITSIHIADGAIINNLIADGTIEKEKIKDLTLTTSKFANSSITTEKIMDNAVTNEKLAVGTITNDRLVDKVIQGNKIADNTIDTSHLIDGCITTNKLANSSVTFEKIAPGAIRSDSISNLSITTAKLADRSVTSIKLALNAVQTENILNSAVSNAKIANDSISAEKIINGHVTTSKLANAAVTTAKIADNNVTTAKINNLSVSNAKLANGAVSADKLNASLKTAIDSSIKLDSTGVATVNGALKVTKNATIGGTLTATKVFNAVYNDLAEGYEPGETLIPGEVVEIREDGKVYKASILSESCVGVISDEYAECFGASEAELVIGKKVAVGLIGKVHVRVIGPVKIGQRLVSIGRGFAGVCENADQKYVIGKALESSDCNAEHKVLCLIYPN